MQPLPSLAEEEEAQAAAAAGGGGSGGGGGGGGGSWPAPPATAALPVSISDLSEQQQQQMLLQLLHPLLLKQFKGAPPVPLSVPSSLELLWQEQGLQQRLEAAAAARAAQQAATSAAAAQAKPAPFDEEARGRGFAKSQPYVPSQVFRHPNPLSSPASAVPSAFAFSGLPGSGGGGGGSGGTRSGAAASDARLPAFDAAALRVRSRELPSVQRYLDAHGAAAAPVELPAQRAGSPQRRARGELYAVGGGHSVA